MGIIGSMISGLFGIGQTALNNEFAAQRAAQDRRENYMYGEMAANEADKRTRALYNDFYSPGALINQYKEAGLSPGMMFGGTPGQGGHGGAQGTGAAGLQTPFMPYSLVEAAQAAQLFAQTEKTKAETKNIEKDTDIKNLEEEWQTMLNEEKFSEWHLFSSYEENGESLYDLAGKHNTFDSFLKDYESKKGQANEYDRRALQKIYLSSYYIDREIATLTNDKVSSDFYKSVTESLNKEDFAKWNAESTVQYLKQNVETNKLDESQKAAWNNLLERIGKRNETAKDVLLIIGMILDKALTQYKLPNIETGGKTININKTE